MLGFTLPLLVLGALEGIVALILLLPLPLCRPGILICKLTNTNAGRTVTICIASFLGLLLLAPLYDIAVLHQYKATTDQSVSSAERRETEATANLSGILTGSCLITLFVVRRLGLALAEVDELRTGTVGVLSQEGDSIFASPDTKPETKKET